MLIQTFFRGFHGVPGELLDIIRVVDQSELKQKIFFEKVLTAWGEDLYRFYLFIYLLELRKQEEKAF